MTPDQLKALLETLYQDRDQDLQQEFHRSLPFQDAMFDRWERARRLAFGEGASIYNSALVFGDVAVGENTWIGPNTLLDGSGGGLSIGKSCSISAGVHIYTHDTVFWAISGGAMPRRTASVSVGDCVYIGSQSVIAAGSTIGERCVVAANSFVNSHIPPGSVVGGSPARRLGRVEGEGADVRIVYDREER